MDSESFKEYLKNRYYDQLNYYEEASGKNQKRYKYIQWVLIVLSALTPVLASINKNNDIQFVVIIVSAIVAILTTGMKTFQYQELWITYRATCEQLKPEIHYYNYNVGPYGEPNVNKEALFISRVEAILDKEHQAWPPANKLKEENKEEEKGDLNAKEADNSHPATDA